jgi:hypothetical protein
MSTPQGLAVMVAERARGMGALTLDQQLGLVIMGLQGTLHRHPPEAVGAVKAEERPAEPQARALVEVGVDQAETRAMPGIPEARPTQQLSIAYQLLPVALTQYRLQVGVMQQLVGILNNEQVCYERALSSN